ncbi:hypothetical protein CCR75_006615 [Bremia lactucae]|uniref:Sugar transporter SWEET1 n=1 Tax=Bremia lactucae TaxID=4779 RepID=A0A976FHF9_BRELC|nr:hypothetical protein CCR75_006615 [Bremia lactucae]
MIVLTIAKVVSIITTVMLRMSLMPDFIRWRKNQSTGEMSIMPCVLLFTNCYVLLFYAYAINDMIPLFAVAVFGFIVGLFLALFFYKWTAYKKTAMRIFVCSFAFCVLMTIYGLLALTGKTGQSTDSVKTTLGSILVSTTVILYASPMATIIHVIRTKTASSMPLAMGVVLVVNSMSWIFYAYLVHDLFIMLPNIAGFILAVTQLILTCVYRKPPPKGQVDNSTRVMMPSVVVVSPVQSCEHAISISPTGSVKSQNFVAALASSKK